MENVKNLIFDLGGVIMDIDVKQTMRAFSNLGLKDIHEYFGHGFAASFFSDHEAGRISDEEFISKIRILLNGEVNQIDLIDAWNALLLQFPPERIQLLKELKSKYRLFLYSNTNAIHYTKFSEIYREAFPENWKICSKKPIFLTFWAIESPKSRVLSSLLPKMAWIQKTLFL